MTKLPQPKPKPSILDVKPESKSKFASNEVEEIMDEDPLKLTSEKVDFIIEYQRKHRGNIEMGVKVKKGQEPKRAFDIAELGIITPKPKVDRRV